MLGLCTWQRWIKPSHVLHIFCWKRQGVSSKSKENHKSSPWSMSFRSIFLLSWHFHGTCNLITECNMIIWQSHPSRKHFWRELSKALGHLFEIIQFLLFRPGNRLSRPQGRRCFGKMFHGWGVCATFASRFQTAYISAGWMIGWIQIWDHSLWSRNFLMSDSPPDKVTENYEYIKPFSGQMAAKLLHFGPAFP